MKLHCPSTVLVAVLATALAPLTALRAADGWPENLTAEGIPPISPELRKDAARYLEFRAAGFSGWLPGKREILITTRFADTTQVHLVKMPGGARKQLTFGTEPSGNVAIQPKQGRCFVFTQDIGGSEFFQLHRYDFADGRTTLLTDGKSRNTGARWSRDGKQLAYTSTRRNGKDNDIRLTDPFDPSKDREVLQVSGGGWSILSWSHDHAKLLLGESVSANESYLHLLDLATGKVEAITPRGGEKVRWGETSFAPGDATVYALNDRGGEFQKLVVLDLKTKEERTLSKNIPWNIEDFALSPDSTRLGLVSNEDGVSIIRVIDAKTGVPMFIPKVPVGVVGALKWHGNDEIGFSLNRAQSPTDAWSLNLASGELTRWTESETGGLDPETFSAPDLVRISSFDGTKMSGFLYRPDAKKFPGKRPCVINIHGGPEGQSLPDFIGRWNYLTAELGVAVFYPNVRGSDGYGKTFLTLDNGFKREDSVKDIGAFIAELKKDPALDGERFAVMGGSYGGYMTLASVIHHGASLRCGVDVVGISNFLTFLKNTQDYRRDLRRVEYGDERDPKMAEHLAKISPTARASEIRIPLFIVQGKNDPRVPVTEAHQMAEAVRKAGGKVWYLEAADEGHGFQKKKNADLMFLSVVQFFRENLLK
jgi:dipeptidyl aminopeptidase/acylaminoacyl peptidase